MADPESAYEIAVNNGFRGTEADWVASLKGKDGRDGVDGKSIVGPKGEKGEGTKERFQSDLSRLISSAFGDTVNEHFHELVESGAITGPKGEAIKGDKGDKPTPEEIRPIVQEVVTEVVAKMPKPKDGKDGKNITAKEVSPIIIDVVGREVTREVAKEVPKEVAKEIAKLPAPKDGLPGKSAYDLWLEQGHKGDLDAYHRWIAQKAGVMTGSIFTNTNTGGAVKSVNGQTGTVSLSLDDLDDVNTTGVVDGNVLSYSGGVWVPSAGGGGSGTVTSVAVTTANGVSASVSNPTTTPNLSFTLGAITPTSVAASGTVTGSNLSGTNTGDQTTITGNAGTATALQTARNINGVSFNGTADITVAAAAGTLTGATLAAGVTASSLTSVGTLGSLTVTGATTSASFNGVSLTTGGAATDFLNGAGSYTVPFTLTTTGSSGAATFSAGTLNIPQYSGGGGTPGGSSGNIQYNNAGAFGGAGTIDSSANMSAIGTIASAAHTITSSSANSLAVGATGTTDPFFLVDSSGTAGAGVKVSSLSSNQMRMEAVSNSANSALTIATKGASSLTLTTATTGSISLQSGISSSPVGGTANLSTSTVNLTGPAGTGSGVNGRVQLRTGNDSAQSITAGAESVGIACDMSLFARRHASNTAITTQRDMLISGSTHTFVTAGGVITNMAALSITAGDATTNAAATNASALYIPTKAFAGTITNGYGVVVDAPTGASTINAAINATGDILDNGNIKLTTAGNGLYIKEGTNATMGVVTLVAGTATVSTTKVTANSRIFLTAQSLGTVTLGQGLAVSARSAGTSFTILSQSAVDTSVVAWHIFEPA